MPEEIVSMSVGKDVIKPIVEAKIQAALVDALGGNGLLVENAVRAIINTKVDDKGSFTTSDYYGKPLIEWLCQYLIKQAAEQAIRTHIEKQKDFLVREFERQFAKKSKTIAESMVAGILDSTKSTWSFNLGVSYKEKKG